MQLIDQLGNKLILDKIPKRIVSLVPSQTEYLFDLGLQDSIVGITKFCIHPKDLVRNVKSVGGTKNCRLEIIDHLNPDIIIANKEENTQSDIAYLQHKYPVYTSDIQTLAASFQMMEDLGMIFNQVAAATRIINTIQITLKEIELKRKNKRAVYFIWRNPWMTVGNDTFIHEMMHVFGFENIYASKTRYPEIDLEDLKSITPEYILLSSEPFPFKQRHIDELKLICPNTKILLVDGEIFSWYGSRLQYAANYFTEILSKQL